MKMCFEFASFYVCFFMGKATRIEAIESKGCDVGQVETDCYDDTNY